MGPFVCVTAAGEGSASRTRGVRRLEPGFAWTSSMTVAAHPGLYFAPSTGVHLARVSSAEAEVPWRWRPVGVQRDGRPGWLLCDNGCRGS
jgi:hypothetical protein